MLPGTCAGAAAAEMAGGLPIPMLMGRPDNLTTLDPIDGAMKCTRHLDF
jgi:hypothetical protein